MAVLDDAHNDDRFTLSADGEDHPLYGHGFAITAHNRRTGKTFDVERKYGYRNEHASEGGMEKAHQG